MLNNHLFTSVSEKKGEVFDRALLFASSVALSVGLTLIVPKTLQVAREYSAGTALICTLVGDINCTKGASFVAEKLGATRRDELNGFEKIVSMSSGKRGQIRYQKNKSL